MHPATAQTHFLSLASTMNAEFTHALLCRNFRVASDPFILPGLAQLVAPEPAPSVGTTVKLAASVEAVQ